MIIEQPLLSKEIMPAFMEDCLKENFILPTEPIIAIFAGAGISEESGLSTFRDNGGLWQQYDVKEVCNIKTFKQNREKVFDFYNQLKETSLLAQPNAAHLAIAQLQNKYPESVVVFTSNVDNLFEKAGCNNVIHIHGDFEHLSCTWCMHRFYIGAEKMIVAFDTKCPSCGRIKTLKPGITFFGEKAPLYATMSDIFAKSSVKHRIIIGTSLQVNGPHFFSLHLPGTSYYIDKNIHDQHRTFFTEIIEEDASIAVPALVNNHYRLINT